MTGEFIQKYCQFCDRCIYEDDTIIPTTINIAIIGLSNVFTPNNRLVKTRK